MNLHALGCRCPETNLSKRHENKEYFVDHNDNLYDASLLGVIQTWSMFSEGCGSYDILFRLEPEEKKNGLFIDIALNINDLHFVNLCPKK